MTFSDSTSIRHVVVIWREAVPLYDAACQVRQGAYQVMVRSFRVYSLTSVHTRTTDAASDVNGMP